MTQMAPGTRKSEAGAAVASWCQVRRPASWGAQLRQKGAISSLHSPRKPDLTGVTLELPQFLNAGMEFKFVQNAVQTQRILICRGDSRPRLTFWKFWSKVILALQGTW